MVLNLDDYHNIHTKRRPDTTTSEVHHFQTILLKAAPEVPAPPLTIHLQVRISITQMELILIL